MELPTLPEQSATESIGSIIERKHRTMISTTRLTTLIVVITCRLNDDVADALTESAIISRASIRAVTDQDQGTAA
jgi:hypothetical protein